MQRVSRLSLELRPAQLDDFGLLPALLWFLDRYSHQTSIQVILKHNGLEQQRFASELETAAYRIVQEALTNVARHARVDRAMVTLWFDQDILGIQVQDEGTGFDPELPLAKGSSSGLLGMKERALLLNGKLTIESSPGTGTRVLAEIPVNGSRLAGGEL
jgi:signal transduction histidine kinase